MEENHSGLGEQGDFCATETFENYFPDEFCFPRSLCLWGLWSHKAFQAIYLKIVLLNCSASFPACPWYWISCSEPYHPQSAAKDNSNLCFL